MILVVGSLNVDYVVSVARAPRPGETVTGTRFATHPGGKGANQAFAAARLGAEVALVGRVGVDTQGTWLVTHLAGGGVDTSAVAQDASTSTGVALIVVDAGGENSIVVAPGANARLGPEAVEACADRFDRARVVLLQLEVPIETVLSAARRARATGSLVLLDPAPASPVPGELIALVDFVTPNETELLTLCGETVAHESTLVLADVATLAGRLRDRGARRVLVKLGSRGALLVGDDGETLCPAPAVDVVDTTAAGDALSGAFAVALSEGLDERKALAFAVTAASISVTQEGAQTSMPPRAEVERWLGRLGVVRIARSDKD